MQCLLPEGVTAAAEIFSVVTLNGIPSVGSLVLALATACLLYRSQRKRSVLEASPTVRVVVTAANRLSQRVTRMSLAITWMFLVLTLPYYITHSIQMALGGSADSILSSITYEVFVFLMYANSAVNCFMYLLVAKQFRRDFVALFKNICGGDELVMNVIPRASSIATISSGRSAEGQNCKVNESVV